MGAVGCRAHLGRHVREDAGFFAGDDKVSCFLSLEKVTQSCFPISGNLKFNLLETNVT